MTPMIAGGLAMAALLLLVLVVATRPWWRRPAAAPQSRRAANVAAFRLRLAELEAELAAGLIPADEAAALRTELEARLLADAEGSAGAPAAACAAPARRPWALVSTAVFLMLFAGLGYYLSGSWQVQQQITAAEPPPVDPQLAALVERLAEHMRAQPGDPQGWAMLGRAYFSMKRYPEAAAAYRQANVHADRPNAEWLTDEGEALAWVAGGEVDGDAAARFEAALQVDPDDDKALWYGGLAAVARGDFEQARARWQRLQGHHDLPAGLRTALDDRLRVLVQIEQKAGLEPGPAPAAARSDAAPLKLHVVLAGALAGRVPAGATLFVFAKAVQGPQMPLAVQRIADPKLPLDLQLDDSMAMAPAFRLSQFVRVTVTARLSAAGTALPASGDLEGSIEVARPAAGAPVVTVTIDHRVP